MLSLEQLRAQKTSQSPPFQGVSWWELSVITAQGCGKPKCIVLISCPEGASDPAGKDPAGPLRRFSRALAASLHRPAAPHSSSEYNGGS